jgi:hypothetical protein
MILEQEVKDGSNVDLGVELGSKRRSSAMFSRFLSAFPTFPAFAFCYTCRHKAYEDLSISLHIACTVQSLDTSVRLVPVNSVQALMMLLYVYMHVVLRTYAVFNAV